MPFIKCHSGPIFMFSGTQSSCWCHTERDSAGLRVLLVERERWLAFRHGMCASWYWVCYREGLQARQGDDTGVLGARGSAHCALGFEPSLCPAWHGRCVLLHRRGARPASTARQTPSCHLVATWSYCNGRIGVDPFLMTWSLGDINWERLSFFNKKSRKIKCPCFWSMSLLF